MTPELPSNLRDLEAQLARRPAPEPPPALRARILSVPVQPPVRRSRYWSAVGWAAVFVVILNVAMCVSNGARFRRLAEVTNLERPAAPATPDADDEFQRYAASALASLRPAAGAGAPDRSLFSHAEK